VFVAGKVSAVEFRRSVEGQGSAIYKLSAAGDGVYPAIHDCFELNLIVTLTLQTRAGPEFGFLPRFIRDKKLNSVAFY
jgi:hypothetical protein